MPKFLGWFLTLAVALLYGVSAMASMGGAGAKAEGICNEPVGKICVVHGGGAGRGHVHVASSYGGHTHGTGCQVCLESRGCAVAGGDEQITQGSTGPERWVPVLFALVTGYAEPTAYNKPVVVRGQGDERVAWGRDMAVVRSTHLLI